MFVSTQSGRTLRASITLILLVFHHDRWVQSFFKVYLINALIVRKGFTREVLVA